MSGWLVFDGLAGDWLVGLGSLAVASTVVYLGIVGINRLLPRHAAGLRHALLGLVLIRLLVPSSLLAPISAWGFFGLSLEASPVATGSPQVALAELSHPGLEMRPGPVTDVRSPRVATVVFVLWLAGAAVVGLSLAGRRRRFRRLARYGAPVVDGAAPASASRWRRRFGIRRRVRLRTTGAPVVPFTLGVLRPVIVLPRQVLDGGEAMVDAVVGHEMAHIRRLDDLWLGMQHLLQAVYFFHPVVWLTGRAMAVERELDCDRRVLRTGWISPASYGRSLLDLLTHHLTPSAASAAISCHRRIKMRIEHIAKTRPGAVSGPWRTFVATTAVALALVPWTATSQEQKAAPQAASRAAEAGSPSELDLQPGPNVFDLVPEARITSHFGPRQDPLGGGPAHHDGIDLSTGGEAQVFVPRGGRVEVATELYAPAPHLGTVVIIDHGAGVKTLYAHLGSLNVESLQGVSDGAVIGTAGSTGEVTGPHLHFELWRDGRAVDPMRLAEVIGDC